LLTLPQNYNLKTAAELGVSEYIKMNIYRNLKIGMVLISITMFLTGCCGPCGVPCNPFHKDKASEQKQPLSENSQK